MQDSAHVVHFRCRTIIEMVRLGTILTDDQRRRKQHERDEAIRNVNAERSAELRRVASVRSPAIHDGCHLSDAYFQAGSGLYVGWYGVERDRPVPVYDCIPDGDWTVLEFWSDIGCRVRTADLLIFTRHAVWQEIEPIRAALVRLEDSRIDQALVDPDRSLFRHPDEVPFWERIVSNRLDLTARREYAAWLDRHGDPHDWVFRDARHSWVFRDARPFRLGANCLSWDEAVLRVDCGSPDRRRTLWGFARITDQDGAIPFTLSDGSPVPQFVAYLLGVTRLRAGEAERVRHGEGWTRSNQMANRLIDVNPEYRMREFRLDVCGCARRFSWLFRPDHSALLELAEQIADGQARPRNPEPAEADPLARWLHSLTATDLHDDYFLHLLSYLGDHRQHVERAAEALAALPPDGDPFADWSAGLFLVGHRQYILVTNTNSLYSTVLPGNGVTDRTIFVERATNSIREFMEADGHEGVFERLIAPLDGSVRFATALNRSITGSMNDMVKQAAFLLETGELSLIEISSRLKETPMTGLRHDGSTHGFPRDVFNEMVERVGSGRLKTTDG